MSRARNNFNQEHIQAALAATDGNMTKAARILGVDRANLYRKMLGLEIAKERGETIKIGEH